ncbi:hypothetical protein CMI37_21735 [Candidatus Pacearchaeota archaeon]|nr:hypothetical protein [Candidatus Pacearchaeota archaeon]|tara:strand:+ start:61 stop:345 length:285 start_codon:yes stop_codon:yes gene_type:complete
MDMEQDIGMATQEQREIEKLIISLEGTAEQLESSLISLSQLRDRVLGPRGPLAEGQAKEVRPPGYTAGLNYLQARIQRAQEAIYELLAELGGAL